MAISTSSSRPFKVSSRRPRKLFKELEGEDNLKSQVFKAAEDVGLKAIIPFAKYRDEASVDIYEGGYLGDFLRCYPRTVQGYQKCISVLKEKKNERV